jgi:hypothetical protein
MSIKKYNKKFFATGIAKINVLPGQIEIHSVGEAKYISAKTEGFFDVHIPIKLLYAFAKTNIYGDLTIEIMNGEVSCRGAKFIYPDIMLSPLLGADNKALPFDATEYELLRYLYQAQGMKRDDFELRMEVISSQERLSERILQSYELLKHYHVTKLELEALVNQKLKT